MLSGIFTDNSEIFSSPFFVFGRNSAVKFFSSELKEYCKAPPITTYNGTFDTILIQRLYPIVSPVND